MHVRWEQAKKGMVVFSFLYLWLGHTMFCGSVPANSRASSIPGKVGLKADGASWDVWLLAIMVLAFNLNICPSLIYFSSTYFTSIYFCFFFFATIAILMLDLPICCEHGSFQDNQSASVYIQIFPESQVVIFGPLHYITKLLPQSLWQENTGSV